MVMPRAVRHINETRALEALLDLGAMSRADLARELGVTRSTASSIVASLMASGLVIDEASPPDSNPIRTGRPSKRVELHPKHAIFLGADIGVGRITIAAIDLASNVVALETVNYDLADTSPSVVTTLLAKEVSSLVLKLGLREAIKGLSISVPGVVDLKGRVIRAPLLEWKNVPILDLLKTSLPDITIARVDHDANAFAVADLNSRKDSPVSEAVYIFADAGVGGCVVSGGNILRGFNGYGGEIGHIVVGERGYFHPTPVDGSFESFVSRDAILARYRELGGKAESISEFLKSLTDKDPIALQVINDWSHYLGRGIATLTSILNPEKIYIGGGLGPLLNLAHSQVIESMRKHLLPDSYEPQIELSELGIEAPAIGAAMMLHREFFEFDTKMLFGTS
ncbi:ROK family transcriptional regulator [Marinomonas mediterranea]|jgi:Transcriptional regulator/sugar kinase|uniref:ROK family protein n=1 Tax=Marinomonas mediterranea (strain ATCC 700492 / JCM 21426 / NBRC 103028 / MMB-1) TaxID=717774 RepID=F2JZ74_MARM1|nr:ROK family transcriptional regulator [Marinomonas mediterranea]ADZ93159.1 ROK family protein [Marinomonas mediterranea MMB-1]WCN11062.1 ROK family protein [Marinomonas mediterranea]WCN15122.1 ROK family protein [Marinomonas mediterranea]WCN19165.1 ROK family protein [Marinomonas mediterranea MMB-1]